MATHFFFFFFTFLSFLSTCSSIPTSTILDAATVLSNSGYISMALTLESASSFVIPPATQSLTIFTPPDTAFVNSGQPSLALLHFHFSPISSPLNSLKSLPPGSKIPTFFPNHSLIITSDGGGISLNGIKINGSAVYDNGSLVIFGIERFLDPEFEVSGFVHGRPVHAFQCAASGEGGGDHLFKEVGGVLRSRGYSAMASFLDLQLTVGFKNHTFLTIFAPIDNVRDGILGNLSEFRSIFFRYFVPCKLSVNDLLNFDDGVLLLTYLEGFKINITTSGDFIMLNGVQVIFPDLYTNDWLAVHGLAKSFGEQEIPHDASNSFSGRTSNSENVVANDSMFLIVFLFCFSASFITTFREGCIGSLLVFSSSLSKIWHF